MDLQDAVQRLRAAKRAHLAWVGRASLLVQGIAVDQDQIPVQHTDCTFGRWYHGEGQVLSALPAFRAIEAPHRTLHDAYAEIFRVLFQEPNPSLFQRLLGTTRRAKENAQAEVESQTRRLVDASREVVALLELLEAALLAQTKRQPLLS